MPHSQAFADVSCVTLAETKTTNFATDMYRFSRNGAATNRLFHQNHILACIDSLRVFGDPLCIFCSTWGTFGVILSTFGHPLGSPGLPLGAFGPVCLFLCVGAFVGLSFRVSVYLLYGHNRGKAEGK